MNKAARVARNFAGIIEDLEHGNTTWSSLPMHMEISTNALCNLNCVMCRPTGAGGVEAYGNERLDAGTVDAIISEMGPVLSMVTPSSGSEPFLGDLDAIADACSRFQILLTVTTNGTLLTAERFEAIQDLLLYLQVSIDSHIPEVYNWIRSGARFERVVENLKQVIPRAAEQGIETCASAVLLKDNVPFLADYIDFAADLGFRRVELQKLYHRFDLGAIDAFGNIPDKDIRTFLGEAVNRARKRKLDLHLSGENRTHYLYGKKGPKVSDRGVSEFLYYLMKRHAGYCFQAAHYIRINPDGKVFPCCNHHESLCMGNIHDRSLREIWNGGAYQTLRGEFFSGVLRPHCASCPILTGFSEIRFRPKSPKWAFRRSMSLRRTRSLLKQQKAALPVRADSVPA